MTRTHGFRSWSRFAATMATALFAATAAAGPIDDMVAFDGHYIPALAATNVAATDPSATGRARAAVQRLTERWPDLRRRLVDTGRGVRDRAGWNAMLVELDRRIGEGDALARRDAFADAHEAFEQVRPAIGTARRRAGIDYFVDRLVDYHEVMERIALAAGPIRDAGLDAAGRDRLERDFAHARAAWLAIERTPVDARLHAMTPERLAQYQRAVADESAALSRLSDALRGSDRPALAAAAAGIKPPFARAYTAFGFAPGEATSR